VRARARARLRAAGGQPRGGVGVLRGGGGVRRRIADVQFQEHAGRHLLLRRGTRTMCQQRSVRPAIWARRRGDCAVLGEFGFARSSPNSPSFLLPPAASAGRARHTRATRPPFAPVCLSARAERRGGDTRTISKSKGSRNSCCLDAAAAAMEVEEGEAAPAPTDFIALSALERAWCGAAGGAAGAAAVRAAFKPPGLLLDYDWLGWHLGASPLRCCCCLRPSAAGAAAACCRSAVPPGAAARPLASPAPAISTRTHTHARTSQQLRSNSSMWSHRPPPIPLNKKHTPHKNRGRRHRRRGPPRLPRPPRAGGRAGSRAGHQPGPHAAGV